MGFWTLLNCQEDFELCHVCGLFRIPTFLEDALNPSKKKKCEGVDIDHWLVYIQKYFKHQFASSNNMFTKKYKKKVGVALFPKKKMGVALFQKQMFKQHLVVSKNRTTPLRIIQFLEEISITSHPLWDSPMTAYDSRRSGALGAIGQSRRFVGRDLEGWSASGL